MSVARSQAAIRELLQKHGVRGVQFSEDWSLGTIGFRFVKMKTIGEAREIPIIVRLAIPLWDDPAERINATERERMRRERQVWRALFWYMKAQLEAVAFGLRTLEDVFMSDIQMPDGRTIGDVVRGEIVAGRLALPEALEHERT